jgi:hypothetical protein
MGNELTQQLAGELDAFRRDGFLIVPGLLNAEETRLTRDSARADDDLHENAFDLNDAQDAKTRISVWNHAGSDIFGRIARAERIVNRMERFLGGEVYHYHSKITLKEPHSGGAWEWHQDYGYWYANGCLYPDLASCFIALDRATKENGCLQVLKGSHHLGRLDHSSVGDQRGADPERVAAALERLELVHCELAPGSAVIFHANLLHCSSANTSASPRWALLCCYNAARNNPYKESRHPRYSPLEKLPDAAILSGSSSQGGTPDRGYLERKAELAAQRRHA